MFMKLVASLYDIPRSVSEFPKHTVIVRSDSTCTFEASTLLVRAVVMWSSEQGE